MIVLFNRYNDSYIFNNFIELKVLRTRKGYPYLIVDTRIRLKEAIFNIILLMKINQKIPFYYSKKVHNQKNTISLHQNEYSIWRGKGKGVEAKHKHTGSIPKIRAF